ncbi:hydrolase [Microbacterium sp. KHB019]|uniref:hydrolase n=1 Tax=Microbacterium sp. KHB019 TaxID=3129770 RepID=UPI0030797AC4
MMRRAVTWFDGGDWHEGVVTADADGVRLLPGGSTAGLPRLDGVVTGGFTDHHVHLQLVDATRLADSTLGRVVDLGGDPAVLAVIALHNSGVLTRTWPDAAEYAPIGGKTPELRRSAGVEILFAGAFLTPPGGYPGGRAWAPAGSVREIADEDAAERAIVEMKDAGAARIKVASNSTAGPVFSDDMLRTIIRMAASHRMPIVAHAEGRGEAQRVVRLGAQRLAHAPFTERLSDAETAAQVASASWISTLAIHGGEEYDTAVDNIRSFHTAGGRVLYGTDMGNGPTPIGLNPHEIAALRDAGIDGSDLLQCLDPTDPRDSGSRLLFFPGGSPDDADPLIARPLTTADLEA